MCVARSDTECGLGYRRQATLDLGRLHVSDEKIACVRIFLQKITKKRQKTSHDKHIMGRIVMQPYLL
jgi:hypothetical protein